MSNLSKKNKKFSKFREKMQEEPITSHSQTIPTPHLTIKQNPLFTLTIRNTDQLHKIIEYIEKNFDSERTVSLTPLPNLPYIYLILAYESKF